MEETKKTTKQSNVVKGIFGFVPFIGFQSARLFSHILEYSVIFFSSAFEKKEIMNPAAWSPPEASTSRGIEFY